MDKNVNAIIEKHRGSWCSYGEERKYNNRMKEILYEVCRSAAQVVHATPENIEEMYEYLDKGGLIFFNFRKRHYIGENIFDDVWETTASIGGKDAKDLLDYALSRADPDDLKNGDFAIAPQRYFDTDNLLPERDLEFLTDRGNGTYINIDWLRYMPFIRIYVNL